MSDADYAHCECSHCSNPSGPCKLCMAVDRADGATLAERAAVVAWLRERAAMYSEGDMRGTWAQTVGAYHHAADAIERGEHEKEPTR